MNADEILRALYLCAAGGQTTLQTSEWCTKAADLIESLQAQLEREIKSANRWICAANDYRKEKERFEETNKAIESDIYNAEMNLEHITAQLAELRKECDIADAANTALHGALEESQRREQAAVKLIDKTYNDKTGDLDFIMFLIDKWRGAQDEKGVEL